MFADPPLQIVGVPDITAVGRAFTLIVLVPVKSAPIDVQRESLNVATVYTVVEVGDTVTLIGLVAPLNDVPSLNVPLHGPVPVTAILIFAEPPLQIVGVPLITAVGRGLTVTVADPLKSADKDVHLESLNEAIVYVVETLGDTLTVIGLVAPLNV